MSPHFVGLPNVWKRIAQRAELEGMTIHGLRHWFASAATDMGSSDLIIGPLLGHAVRGITSRYASPSTAGLRAAADRISATLAAHLDGTAGEVVQFIDTARTA